MLTILRKFHGFLSDQLLYPLVLSTLLAIGIFTGRILISHQWTTYKNLVWNLFLAWVPYIFSVVAASIHRVFPKHWWLLIVPSAIWLAFFPNAPYIVTDFLHLQERPGVPLWYDIGLLATFAWTGLFLAIASLRTFQRLVKFHFGLVVSWLFAFVALGLGGLGLYLGRFSRWNSWDLLSQPKEIIVDVATKFKHPLSNLGFFGFTLMFTGLLFVCYFMFISIRRLDEPENLMDQNHTTG